MKLIRVQYTITKDFVETNKQNIKNVMTELRGMNRSDIRYASFQHEDENTFMHLVLYATSQAESLPSELDSFKEFQKQLKENLEIPPKAETFSLVGSSYEIF